MRLSFFFSFPLLTCGHVSLPRVLATDSCVMYEYVTYPPPSILIWLKAVTSSFPSNQTTRYFYYLLCFRYSVNFTWRAMDRSIMYTSLGLMRKSIDFLLPSKGGSLYLQYLIVPCLKEVFFVYCNTFFEGGFTCRLFFSSLPSLILFNGCAFFILLFVGTKQLGRIGGIFSFPFFHLRQTKC